MLKALLGAIYGNGVWVRVGMSGLIQSSTDGVAWLTRNSTVFSHLWGVAYGNGVFIAVGDDGTIVISSNGSVWTQLVAPTNQDLFDIHFADVFMVVGGNGLDDSFIGNTVFGTAWSIIPSGTTSRLRGVSANTGHYIASGDDEVIIIGAFVSAELNIGASETLKLQDSVSTQLNVAEVFTDTLGLIADMWHDEERRILREIIHERWGMTNAENQNIQIMGDVQNVSIGFSEGMVPNETIFETLGLSAKVIPGYALSLSETLGLNDAALIYQAFTNIIDETLGLDASLTDKFSFFVTNVDTLGLTDTVTTTQVFGVLVEEGIGFAVQLIINDTEYIGWVINSKNLAISKYLNYQFNSFASYKSKYYGANQGGVYDLSGDDDAGADIVTAIKTGLMNFGSEFQKRIPRAYIGIRNDNRVILKTVTNEDVERWYELTATHKGMSRDRFKLNKGVKSAYWQFELVTIGPAQIETLTLMPILLTRRPK